MPQLHALRRGPGPGESVHCGLGCRLREHLATNPEHDQARILHQLGRCDARFCRVAIRAWLTCRCVPMGVVSHA